MQRTVRTNSVTTHCMTCSRGNTWTDGTYPTTQQHSNDNRQQQRRRTSWIPTDRAADCGRLWQQPAVGSVFRVCVGDDDEGALHFIRLLLSLALFFEVSKQAARPRMVGLDGTIGSCAGLPEAAGGIVWAACCLSGFKEEAVVALGSVCCSQSCEQKCQWAHCVSTDFDTMTSSRLCGVRSVNIL